MFDECSKTMDDLLTIDIDKCVCAHTSTCRLVQSGLSDLRFNHYPVSHNGSTRVTLHPKYNEFGEEWTDCSWNAVQFLIGAEVCDRSRPDDIEHPKAWVFNFNCITDDLSAGGVVLVIADSEKEARREAKKVHPNTQLQLSTSMSINGSVWLRKRTKQNLVADMQSNLEEEKNHECL